MARLVLALTICAVTLWFLGGTGHAGQRALVIGIAEYKAVTPLMGPKNDAEEVYDFLISQWGFKQDEVKRLINRRARRSSIRAALNGLVRQTNPGDRVVIYYAGHGSQVRDRNDDETDGLDETLVPYDFEAGRQPRQILDDDIYATLKKLKGRRVILIVDACHSGTISRSIGLSVSETSDARPRTLFGEARDVAPDTVTAFRSEESFAFGEEEHQIWTAAASFQMSWEENGRGIFTRHFLEGLRDFKADFNLNGHVSTAELLRYSREKTEAWCQKNESCRTLGLGFTPTLEASANAMRSLLLSKENTSQADTLTEEGLASVNDVTDIVVASNAAGLTVETMAGPDYRAGEVIRMRVSTQKAGWLILLDYAPDGTLTQIFPNGLLNREDRTSRIAAGETITFPEPFYGFEFVAGEPYGQGQVIAILTEDEVDFGALLDPEGDEPFKVAENGQAELAKVVKALSDVWRGGDRNRPIAWSLASQDYSVRPKP